MKPYLRLFPLLAAATLLCSCATTSLVKSWRTPEPIEPPVTKIAIVAVDDRPLVRKVLEGQFSAQIRTRGYEAEKTCELMTIPQMRTDRTAAGARMRETGSDAVLIMRLISSVSLNKVAQQTPSAFGGTITTYGEDGWFVYFVSTAYEVTYTSPQQAKVYLESSLYDLKTGKLLWRGVTKTAVNDYTDKLAEVKPLVTLVLDAMAKDGVIR